MFAHICTLSVSDLVSIEGETTQGSPRSHGEQPVPARNMTQISLNRRSLQTETYRKGPRCEIQVEISTFLFTCKGGNESCRGNKFCG